MTSQLHGFGTQIMRLQRLEWQDPTPLALQRIGAGLLGDRVDRLLLVFGKRVIQGIEVLVDYSAHALLAVVSDGLRAEVPKGLLILDHEGEGLVCRPLLCGEVKAGVDSSSIR